MGACDVNSDDAPGKTILVKSGQAGYVRATKLILEQGGPEEVIEHLRVELTHQVHASRDLIQLHLDSIRQDVEVKLSRNDLDSILSSHKESVLAEMKDCMKDDIKHLKSQFINMSEHLSSKVDCVGKRLNNLLVAAAVDDGTDVFEDVSGATLAGDCFADSTSPSRNSAADGKKDQHDEAQNQTDDQSDGGPTRQPTQMQQQDSAPSSSTQIQRPALMQRAGSPVEPSAQLEQKDEVPQEEVAPLYNRIADIQHSLARISSKRRSNMTDESKNPDESKECTEVYTTQIYERLAELEADMTELARRLPAASVNGENEQGSSDSHDLSTLYDRIASIEASMSNVLAEIRCSPSPDAEAAKEGLQESVPTDLAPFYRRLSKLEDTLARFTQAGSGQAGKTQTIAAPEMLTLTERLHGLELDIAKLRSDRAGGSDELAKPSTPYDMKPLFERLSSIECDLANVAAGRCLPDSPQADAETIASLRSQMAKLERMVSTEFVPGDMLLSRTTALEKAVLTLATNTGVQASELLPLLSTSDDNDQSEKAAPAATGATQRPTHSNAVHMSTSSEIKKGQSNYSRRELPELEPNLVENTVQSSARQERIPHTEESKAQDAKVTPMAIEFINDRLTRLEKGLGEVKDKNRKRSPTAIRSAERRAPKNKSAETKASAEVANSQEEEIIGDEHVVIDDEIVDPNFAQNEDAVDQACDSDQDDGPRPNYAVADELWTDLNDLREHMIANQKELEQRLAEVETDVRNGRRTSSRLSGRPEVQRHSIDPPQESNKSVAAMPESTILLDEAVRQSVSMENHEPSEFGHADLEEMREFDVEGDEDIPDHSEEIKPEILDRMVTYWKGVKKNKSQVEEFHHELEAFRSELAKLRSKQSAFDDKLYDFGEDLAVLQQRPPTATHISEASIDEQSEHIVVEQANVERVDFSRPRSRTPKTPEMKETIVRVREVDAGSGSKRQDQWNQDCHAMIRQLQERVLVIERELQAAAEQARSVKESHDLLPEKTPVSVIQLLELQDDLVRLKTRFEYIERCVPPDVLKALRYFEPQKTGLDSAKENASAFANEKLQREAKEAKIVSDNAMREVANLSFAMRGLQRDLERVGSKVEDSGQSQTKLRFRFEEALPKLLSAVQKLMPESISPDPGTGDAECQESKLRALTSALDDQNVPSFVSQDALHQAIQGVKDDAQKCLCKVEKDLMSALQEKADSKQVLAIVDRINVAVVPPVVSAGSRGASPRAEETVAAAAATRSMLRCLSCDTVVAPSTAGSSQGRRSPAGTGRRQRLLSPMPGSGQPSP